MDSCYHFVLSTGLLLAAQIILSTVVVQAQNTNFHFSSFSSPDSFLMAYDTQYDTANPSFLLNQNAEAAHNGNGTCGRLFYKDKVRMKDLASGAVASFHTAFTFQITGKNCLYNQDGDGLAFTFVRDSNIDSLDNSWSGWTLCLLKWADNGDPTNPVFAVEFDTYKNDWLNDPSNNHIGVDVNNMNSTWYHNLCGGTDVSNCSYLCNGGYFTAWIDYDSRSQKLEVFFANGSMNNNIPKPTTPVIEANLSESVPLAQLVDDYMYVGFSSSTGLVSEVHQIQSWTFTSSGMPELKNIVALKQIAIGVTVAGVTLTAMIVAFSICWWKYRHPLHIFVSHTGGQNGDQKNFSIHLSNALTASWRSKYRFDVFIDRKRLRRGMPFPEEIQGELARVDLGIVVVSREFFQGKWPMMELVEMVELQKKKPAKVRILPLFYTLKPGGIRNLLRNGDLQAEWEKMATAKYPVDVPQYERAVEKLCTQHGVEYNYSDLSHEEEYIREILEVVNGMYREMRKKS